MNKVFVLKGIFFTVLALLSFFCTPNGTQAVESFLKLNEKWTGDFDGMVERHVIRALIPYSKTFYFLDGAEQRGLTFEKLREFEKYVKKCLR